MRAFSNIEKRVSWFAICAFLPFGFAVAAKAQPATARPEKSDPKADADAETEKKPDKQAKAGKSEQSDKPTKSGTSNPAEDNSKNTRDGHQADDATAEDRSKKDSENQTDSGKAESSSASSGGSASSDGKTREGTPAKGDTPLRQGTSPRKGRPARQSRPRARRPVSGRKSPARRPPPTYETRVSPQPHPAENTKVAKGKKKKSLAKSKEGIYSTVVVSGVRPELVLDSPRSVEAIPQGEIVRKASRSTPEILTNTPGVVVQKTNHGGGSPFIRGFTGQHVLYMIDGIRLNNSTVRYGPNQALNTIDPFTIRRIEVLRGPGSSLYGSDAIGGVLRIMTRDAPMVPGAVFRWGGTATARMGTADRSQIYNVGAWTQYRRASVFLGGTFKHFNDLTGGRGVGKQDWTGYDEGDWDGAVKVLLGGEWMLKVATSGVRQDDVPRTDKCSATDFRFFTHQDRDLFYTKLTGAAGRYLDHFDATLSYQRHNELRHRYRLGRDRIEREWDRVHTAGIAVTAGTDLGRYSRLTYGIDLYHDWVYSTQRRTVITTGAVSFMDGADFRGRFVDGSRYLQSGIFAYDRIKPLDWLRVHVGGRLALSHADIPADPLADVFGFESENIQKTFIGPVGGASLTFIPWKNLHLITSVQQGYRAPNLDDYSHVGSEGPAFDVPSPNLDRAETSTTLEVGAKFAYGWLSAWVFGHYSFLRNFIARRYTGELVDGEPAAVRANAAKGYVAGVEGYVGVRFPRGFSAETWISWTRGDIEMPFQDPITQPIRRMSPLQGAASVGYAARNQIWAKAFLRWSARQDRLSPGDLNDARICPAGAAGCTGTPGFAIISLAGGVPLSRYVDFVLHIHNLTNEKYKFHGSGVYGPGLSAIAELRVKVQ
jgi:outer membrane receptor protein involved in Fe transport